MANGHMDHLIQEATRIVQEADAIIIAAGAAWVSALACPIFVTGADSGKFIRL